MPRSRHVPVDDGESCCELLACTLDQLAKAGFATANETHRNGELLAEIRASIDALLELYRGAHPDQALLADRLAKLEAKQRECCEDEEPPEDHYHYEPCHTHGGRRDGSEEGWSVKARASVPAEDVPERHKRWSFEDHERHTADKSLPPVEQGPFVGFIVPSTQTPAPMDFRSGSGPVPGAQEPVTFRTFTDSGLTDAGWPPDMSGAKAGDVVVMSGNLWLKVSFDAGKTFSDLKFTDLFANETKYGGWAGDQVIHYVPEIDCFVLYVQSRRGTGADINKSVVKVAIASPADLKVFKGGKAAWRRQWHFSSDTFGINAWLDFPDLSYGAGYLYVNTNTFALPAGGKEDDYAGKLFWELPLAQLKAGGTVSFYYAHITDDSPGSPTQNIGDENYFASHVGNSKLRIYSSKGSDENYYWRERSLLANWPTTPKNSAGKADIVSKPPDATDWISGDDNRIIGATKVNNQLWFAWTAAAGTGTSGGFKFPQAHIQIAKVDLGQDYKVVDQMQVWNAGYAFCYPSLTTNSNNEVGISCAWGGGSNYGSHVVGILGDYVLWYGEASDKTAGGVRFGDYLHVRLAHPDTRFFSGFGYAVRNTSPGERVDYLYVEFGREPTPVPQLH